LEVGHAIECWIDAERRLVLTRGHGTFTSEDVFGYQRDVWSRPEVAGFDELADMSGVEHITLPSPHRIQELAQASAGMDPPASASRFAIVAPTELAFGLGRMYETYRALEDRSTKQVAVFRTMEQALEFLGISGPLEPGKRPAEVSGAKSPSGG
jgi:hypothetical protein